MPLWVASWAITENTQSQNIYINNYTYNTIQKQLHELQNLVNIKLKNSMHITLKGCDFNFEVKY